RDPRRDRAAGLRDERAFAAGVQVAADDRVDEAVGILVVLERLTGRDVLAVVEIPPVRRERRLAGVLLPAVLLGDLEALGAADVIHPDLAGAAGPLADEVPARVDVLAVRRPGRAVHVPALLARDLTRAGAVRPHHPDVREAVAVAREGNPAAVRAEARLHVVGGAA